MKKFLVIVVTVLSIGIIVAGKVHWDNKISAKAEVKVQTASNIETANEENIEIASTSKEEIMKLATNLPDAAVIKIENAIKNQEPVHLVILGSAATPEESGWTTILKEELKNTYGDKIFKVTIKEIADKMSTEIINEKLYEEAVELNPDILLFEPFILYDNGKVRIEHRIENLEMILAEFKNSNPDLLVLLQPANPLHNAVHYPIEVEELKRYAELNNYIYLNHWEAWPDQNSDEILEYLEVGRPNEKGHELWAEFLIDYFTAKSETLE